jgi:hypothetical protein
MPLSQITHDPVKSRDRGNNDTMKQEIIYMNKIYADLNQLDRDLLLTG